MPEKEGSDRAGPDRGGAFFGRRKGKTLRRAQRETLQGALPGLLIDIGEPAPEPLLSLFDNPVDDVRLEIGFGGGEHLLHEARTYPQTGLIGVEPFENGLAKAVAAIEGEAYGNIRLFDEDAVRLLDWLPGASLSRIDLLYPDPWPKTRHWKRRFVQGGNLDRIARCLRPGGTFRFASDVDAYVRWTLSEVARHGGLTWTAADLSACRTPWEGWPGTRYEAKALAEDRRPAYLTFRKAPGHAGPEAAP
jgi:tRNA (guanine-N7-)-methyltransferase